MRGIILAAGCARRLEPAVSGKPKCLIDFGGRSLIEHQITALSHIGVTECTVVVGYEQQQIRDHLAKHPMRIAYVENPLYDSTNTLYSLWLATEYFYDDFIYCNADVLFDHRVAERLIDKGAETSLACIRGRCGDEEVKVVTDKDRILAIGKHLPKQQCFGEFIGVARFGRVHNPLFREILSDCVQDRANWTRFFEYAVDFLAQKVTLRVVDISDLPTIEIDFPEDLEYARRHVFPLLAPEL
jgi:choline kinase